MRIVQVCPYDMTRPGGVQRHIRDLSAWLERRGHSVRVICPPPPGRHRSAPGGVTTLGRSWRVSLHGTRFELSLATPWRVAAMARELRDWGADLMHFHTPWTPALPTQLWRALPLPGVATFHATIPDPQAPGMAERYIRRSARLWMRRCDRLVVPSRSPLEMLRAVQPDIDVSILPPAVDLAPWRTAKSEASGSLRVAYLGRLEPRKGVETLLAAWELCQGDLPDARLIVAGDGPLRASVERAVSDRLDYLGPVSDAQARALLANAEIFAAPALFGESYGLVLAEALAAGAVPLAADNPGYRAFLGDQGRALLMPPGDAVAMAAKLTWLAKDHAARHSWREWGAEHVRQADIEHVGPAYEALYAGIS